MRLSDEQVTKLRGYLKRNAPSIDRPEERMSRRIEGVAEMGTGDARGYRAVIAYIQSGLGDQEELARQVLSTVAKVQNDYHLKYPVCLFSFGWDDSQLHHAGEARQGVYRSNTNDWVRELCDLAGNTSSQSPAVVPCLFPNARMYSRKTHVEKDDLLLFFCRDRDVRLHEQASKEYNQRIMRNAIWLFCGPDEVEVQSGHFSPESCG